MTDFNRTESGKWAIASAELVGKYEEGRDKALSDAASRGFAAADGSSLAAILAMGQETKSKLTEFNGTKIYDERRKTLFEVQEFEMKMIVSLAKLGMELYRAELFNLLEIEAAQNTALRDRGNADVIAMNAEVDKRQVAIIRARAEAERRVTVLKAQLVVAEEGTLPYETALVTAQLATAEKKLEIIDSIYQVLAAEELVLVAENNRAATLTLLLAAELIVAGVKREMIPFYIEKAGARLQLAEAIKTEIPITEAIINLGFDRIDLKTTDEYASHLEREAQEELELLQAAWIRANKATELTRTQARRLLQEYANIIQAEIMAKKKSLAEDGIDLELETSLARQAIGVDNEVTVSAHDVSNLTAELINILLNITARASDEVSKVKASATQTSISQTYHLYEKQIVEGLLGGITVGGTMGS